MEKPTQHLRILFISRTFPPVVGGIERQNFEIYKHLSEIADVKLIANRYGKRFLPLFLLYSIVFVLWKSRHYDVLLLGDGVLAIIAWVMSRIKRSPLIVCIIHGLDLTFQKSIYQNWWVRRFLPVVDVLLPVSHQTALEAQKRGLREDRCHVIPNGVNPDDFTTKRDLHRLEVLLGKSVEAKCIILTVGRLIARKGVHWFVENVMPVLDEDIVYIIAGDGPIRKNIEEIVKRKGLETRVHVLGQVNNNALLTLYSTADIFVQPNIPVKNDMEGFGLVVLEAGASGLPVVASRIEGLIDAISEGDNGELLTPCNVDEYVKHINMLVRDPVSRHAKGQSALNYVRQYFTWKVIAERYLNVFYEALYQQPPKKLM